MAHKDLYPSKASIGAVTEEEPDGARLKAQQTEKPFHSNSPEAESGSVPIPQATREPPKPGNAASLLGVFP